MSDDLQKDLYGIIENAQQETKIGSDSRQFEYTETEFSAFDRFLFSTWKMKKYDFWGNALRPNEKPVILHKLKRIE